MERNLLTHTGFEAISQIREPWERLQHHPNSDFEHFLLVCELRKEVLYPWALSIWEGGDCRAIVAGRIENVRFRPAIGYAKFPGIRVKVLSIIHEGILGDLDDRGAEDVIHAALSFLKNGNVKAVWFHNLSDRFSGLWSILAKEARSALGAPKPRWYGHWVLELGKKTGFLLERMQPKHRRMIRSTEKRLTEAFHGKLEWSWHSEFTDVSQICEKIEEIAKTTYQRGLGAGFVDNEENRRRLNLFASWGQLRVMLLEIDGRPASFWFGTLYRGIFHPEATGYRPDMSKYEMGTLTLLKMVDRLVEEGVESVDFGIGDATYKERYAAPSGREADVRLFGNSITGRLLGSYLGSVGWLDEQARMIVFRLGVLDRVKKVWRAKVRGRTKE